MVVFQKALTVFHVLTKLKEHVGKIPLLIILIINKKALLVARTTLRALKLLRNQKYKKIEKFIQEGYGN